MSLIAMEGFEAANNNAELPYGYWDQQYNVNSSNSVSAVRTGAFGGTIGSYGYLRMDPSNEDEVIFGFMFHPTYGSNGTLAHLIDDGTIQCTLVREAGVLKVFRGSSSGTLLGTSSVNLTYDQDFLEWRVKIHGTAGTVDLKVNGTSGLSLTSQNTQASANAYATLAGFGYPGAGYNDTGWDYFDDLYIIACDATSPNSWIGQARVGLAVPVGAGNYTQWTPSTGSNYQCVDEWGINSDTDYVVDGTASQKDTYAVTDISESAVNIFGVRASASMRKDDAGYKSARIICRTNSTDYSGTTCALLDGYNFFHESWTNNPDTSSPWEKSEFNAAEFGAEVVS